MLDLHPFMKSFGAITRLPPQMIPLKEKEKNKDENGVSEWMKRCLDALDIVARRQYIENQSLITNERLVNGEFIPQDYFYFEDGDDSFLDPVEELVKQGKLPKFIKHYDIISKPINTQVQEFCELPDSFHVIGFGEKLQSEKMQQQTDMLHDWFNDTINERFSRFLAEQGIDENQEFESEEEKQQFLLQVDELRKSKTPKEIGDYMKSDYRHIAELWAEYELQDQKQRFKLDQLRRQEFKDLLIHARRFRHLKIGYYGLEVETWNPVKVFYYKSPDVQYVQRGDYAGKFNTATTNYLIDKHGKYMSAKQQESFNSVYDSNWKVKPTTDWFGNPVNYADTNGVPYDTWLPSFNPTLNRIAPHLGFNYSPNLFGIGESASSSWINNQLYTETEAYWKSFELIYKLDWINPESGLREVVEVDETFVFPSYIKIIKDKNYTDSQELNTAIASWREVVYQGTIIRNYSSGATMEPMYLNCKKLDYQRTSPFKNEVLLPVVGQIINNRNTKPTSQVDKLKPYQFLVNVALNKAAKLQERSFMPYVVMDMNLIPNQGDWGGEDALVKWLMAGQEAGVVPVDTSPSNTQGAAQTGGQYPRIVDVDITPRIVAQLEIARNLTLMAYEQIGITPQRLGDVKGIDTATGINTSVAKSYLATGSWFTEFWECEREILQQQLDIAQWLEAQNKEITKQFVNSDFTTGWLKFANNNFNLYDLKLYVSNSQEELRKKKLYQELALSNNTVITDMSVRMEMLDNMTPTERILQIVKSAEEKATQQQQQLQELKQKEIESKDANEKAKLQQEYDLKIKELETKERVAWIGSREFMGADGQDLDNSGTPDAFEFEKYKTQASIQYGNLGLNRDKHALDKDKEAQRIREKQAELNLKQQELALKNKQIDQTAQNVKYLDKGKKK
jgi:hypothetical protein